MRRTGKHKRARAPAAGDANTPEAHVELNDEASLQVARALARPPRVIPELVLLFTEEPDHAANAHFGDGSPT